MHLEFYSGGCLFGVCKEENRAAESRTSSRGPPDAATPHGAIAALDHADELFREDLLLHTRCGSGAG